MDVIVRIEQFIKCNKLSLSDFDRSIGAANGYIGKQISKGGSIGSHIIEKIVYAYPSLNIRWLMTGEGEMFEKTIDIDKNSTTNDVAISDQFNFSVIDIQPTLLIDIVNSLELSKSSINAIDTADKSEFNKHLLGADKYLCLKYQSLGMFPTIKKGTYLLIQKTNKLDFEIGKNEQVYVVYSKTGIYFGRLTYALGKQFIVITMDNPDKNNYPNLRINVAHVMALWRVKSYMFSAQQGMPKQKDVSIPISEIEDDLKNLQKKIKKVRNLL